MDIRCAGTALREIAKSVALGEDIGPGGFAKLEQLVLQVLEASSTDQAIKRGGGLPRVLSGTAWSFAKLSYGDCTLLAALSSEARRRLSDFEPRDISATAWAWAKMLILD